MVHKTEEIKNFLDNVANGLEESKKNDFNKETNELLEKLEDKDAAVDEIKKEASDLFTYLTEDEKEKFTSLFKKNTSIDLESLEEVSTNLNQTK